jgi:hypothetical protein
MGGTAITATGTIASTRSGRGRRFSGFYQDLSENHKNYCCWLLTSTFCDLGVNWVDTHSEFRVVCAEFASISLVLKRALSLVGFATRSRARGAIKIE